MRLLRSMIMVFSVLTSSLGVCIGAPYAFTSEILARSSEALSIEAATQIGMMRMLEYQIQSEIGQRKLDREQLAEVGLDCLESRFGLTLDEGTANYFGNFRATDDRIVAGRQRELLICVQKGIRKGTCGAPQESAAEKPRDSFQERLAPRETPLPSPLLAAMTSFGIILLFGAVGAAILYRPRR